MKEKIKKETKYQIVREIYELIPKLKELDLEGIKKHNEIWRKKQEEMKLPDNCPNFLGVKIPGFSGRYAENYNNFLPEVWTEQLTHGFHNNFFALCRLKKNVLVELRNAIEK